MSVSKIERYTYINCEPSEKHSFDDKEEMNDDILKDDSSFHIDQKSKVLSQFRENIAIDLSTPIDILEKMERLWFIFSVDLSDDEKMGIEDIAYAFGAYYCGWSKKDGKDELCIELFSLEKLEEIRKKIVPPVFENTFRRIEEGEEEEYQPPKKEEKKPTYWHRTTDPTFKKQEEPYHPRKINKKKQEDGWTTISKRK